MQNILEKIHTHASIVVCDDVEIEKENLLSVINKVENSTIKIFEKNGEKGTVNFAIDEARELVDYQKTKSANKRFVVINKKFIRGEGQSALLKVLEEPSENTFIIILTTSTNTILPTILSRCVILDERKEKSKDSIKNSFIKNKDFKNLERLLTLENAGERGSISAKYVADFARVVL